MILSSQMIAKVKKQLEEYPLEADELRRVEGMGLLFVSRSLEHVEECSHAYSLSIDGTKYHFFVRR